MVESEAAIRKDEQIADALTAKPGTVSVCQVSSVRLIWCGWLSDRPVSICSKPHDRTERESRDPSGGRNLRHRRSRQLVSRPLLPSLGAGKSRYLGIRITKRPAPRATRQCPGNYPGGETASGLSTMPSGTHVQKISLSCRQTLGSEFSRSVKTFRASRFLAATIAIL